MSCSLKTVSIVNGIKFNTVIDNRFKTNRISINFITVLNKDTVTINALIPQLLKKGYEGCDNYTLLNRKLESLYGAYIEGGVQKKGDTQILTLAITGIDDKFTLNNEEISKELAQILCNMTLNPLVKDGGFYPEYVETEKKVLVDAIESELSEKRVYAINSAIKLMCKDEPFGLPKYGFKEEIDKITPKSLKEQYDNILKTSQVEIMFTGTGDDSAAFEVFDKAFKNIERDFKTELTSKKHISDSDDIKSTTECMPVNQAKMVLGFSGDIDSNDTLSPAMRLMVTILGGTPSSKLFLNVREKLSLCYYCAARYDMLKGIMLIDSGVENQNIKKAKDEILLQLDEMKKGNISDEEINQAVLSLKNSYSSVYEYDYTIESFYLNQILSKNISSPETEKHKLDTVTKKDLIDAANKIKLDTMYVLAENEVEL